MTTAHPRLGGDVLDDLDRRLAPADADLAARYPGDAGARQPVHTVYVPADQMTPGLAADWGGQALAALDRHAGGAPALAEATGVDPGLTARVYPSVLDKLAREPIEDLRLDFEDGYGSRPDEREDQDAVAAARALAEAAGAGTAPPYVGLRGKSLELPAPRPGPPGGGSSGTGRARSNRADRPRDGSRTTPAPAGDGRAGDPARRRLRGSCRYPHSSAPHLGRGTWCWQVAPRP